MDEEWKDKGCVPFGDGEEVRLYDPDVDCIPEELRPVKSKINIMRDL